MGSHVQDQAHRSALSPDVTGHGRPVRIAAPANSAHQALLRLQASAGNRAVARMLAAGPDADPAAIQRRCTPDHRGPKRSYGVSMNAISTDWGSSGMSTRLVLSAYVSVRGVEELTTLCDTQNAHSTAHGSEHAEDVAIRVLRNNLTLFRPAPHVNELWMSITKSPCTSISRTGLPVTSQKATGCTEELINLVATGLTGPGGAMYTFRLTVHVFGLYMPKVPGYTQDDVLDASQEALEALRANPGISVTSDVRTGSGARFGAT